MRNSGNEEDHREKCLEKVDNANGTEKKEDKQKDEEYWEEMLFLSLGPRGWNIGCGCG